MRRRSTGSSDRQSWVRIIKDNINIKEESNRDSLSDERYSSSDSDEAEKDISAEFFFSHKKKISEDFQTSVIMVTQNNSETCSDSSLQVSESDSEEDEFHPELFGLLNNPGVMRFNFVDYPLEVSAYSDEEDLAASEHNTALDWIRVSYDDLTLDSNTADNRISDRKILSRSLDTH